MTERPSPLASLLRALRPAALGGALALSASGCFDSEVSFDYRRFDETRDGHLETCDQVCDERVTSCRWVDDCATDAAEPEPCLEAGSLAVDEEQLVECETVRWHGTGA